MTAPMTTDEMFRVRVFRGHPKEQGRWAMKTKYILCLGAGPDDILVGDDDDGFSEDSLSSVQCFTSKAKARKEFKRYMSGATNMKVNLIEVKLISAGVGRLT